MTSLPTPAEALERSLDAFENGDRDAARYWLAVATELRAGNPPKPVVHVFDAQNLAAGAVDLERQAQQAPPAEADDVIWTDERGVQFRHTEASRRHMATDHPKTDACWHDPATIGMAPVTFDDSDATAIVSTVTGGDGNGCCDACGRPTIEHEGRIIHRATYKTECEFATVGR